MVTPCPWVKLVLMTSPPSGETPSSKSAITGVLLRAGLFLLFIRISGGLFGAFLNETVGYFPAATLSIFAASSLATWFVLRVFERAHLANVGMGWTPNSPRHLRLGFLGGVTSGLLIVGLPLLAGFARFEKLADPASGFSPASFVFVSVLLLFGAVGEEIMFRGYAFQIVLAALGPWATILPFAVLFGWAHAGNINSSVLGLFNTGLWGALLGYAFWRSGDLWLPIGLHFGWNWILPVFGSNLSGFTLSLSGYAVRWDGPAWITGGDYGPEGSVLTTLAVFALGYWLFRVRIVRETALLVHPMIREDGNAEPASHPKPAAGAAGRSER